MESRNTPRLAIVVKTDAYPHSRLPVMVPDENSSVKLTNIPTVDIARSNQEETEG